MGGTAPRGAARGWKGALKAQGGGRGALKGLGGRQVGIEYDIVDNKFATILLELLKINLNFYTFFNYRAKLINSLAHTFKMPTFQKN